MHALLLKQRPHVQCWHSVLFFSGTHSRSPLLYSVRALVALLQESPLFLSSRRESRRLDWIHLSIPVTASAEVPRLLQPRPAIPITRFSCWDVGAAMHTNYTWRFPLSASCTYLPACIWPLLLLQFPHLRHFLSRLVWLELGLARGSNPVGTSLARELGRRK